MKSFSETIGGDLESFAKDFEKVAEEFDRASDEPGRLCDLVQTTFRVASLRVLGACMDEDQRPSLKALVLDDLDASAARHLRIVERVAKALRKAGITAGSSGQRGPGERARVAIPRSDSKALERVEFEPYLLAGDGVPMAFVRLTSTDGETFTFREPLPSVTGNAVMLIGVVVKSYEALMSRGVSASALSECAIESQRAVNIELLHHVRAICEALEFDWDEIVKESGSDE